MYRILLHVFRNNPAGRETLLQSLSFCRAMGLGLRIYIPTHKKFLMYFEKDLIQVDLDGSYLTDPDTAKAHVLALAEEYGVVPEFFEPTEFTGSTLPDVPSQCDFMCCPRSISEANSKVGLGHIGPKVRKIVQAAPFPVLIPSPCFREIKSLTLFFGGSANAFKALALGLEIRRRTGLPLDLFTLEEKDTDRESMEKLLHERGVKKAVDQEVRQWNVVRVDSLDSLLYDIPRETLAILGAYGHGVIREFLFGSKMEIIQATLTQNLLIVGPYCSPV